MLRRALMRKEGPRLGHRGWPKGSGGGFRAGWLVVTVAVLASSASAVQAQELGGYDMTEVATPAVYNAVRHVLVAADADSLTAIERTSPGRILVRSSGSVLIGVRWSLDSQRAFGELEEEPDLLGLAQEVATHLRTEDGVDVHGAPVDRNTYCQADRPEADRRIRCDLPEGVGMVLVVDYPEPVPRMQRGEPVTEVLVRLAAYSSLERADGGHEYTSAQIVVAQVDGAWRFQRYSTIAPW